MTTEAKFHWAIIILLAVSTVYAFYWVWGLLFILWSIQSLTFGRVFLLSRIYRKDEPILFFAVTAMWFAFGVWELMFDLLWRFGIDSFLGWNFYGG